MNKIFQRRRYLLRDSSQPRVLLAIQTLFLFVLVLSGAALFLMFNQDLTTTYLQAHVRIGNVLDLLLPTLVVVTLVGWFVSATLMIFYTHRIVGPVYRLCRILRQVGEGNLTQSPAFRRGDELKELERAAQDMLDQLERRIDDLRRHARGATALTETLLSSYPNLTELEYLRETTVEIESQLAAFRLKSDQNTNAL